METPLQRVTPENQNIESQNNKIDDERLHYVLITLGLEELINLFVENNITFIDLLLLSKEDLLEFQLELYQRNRIWSFCTSFQKYAKTYSTTEIKDFFLFNRQYLFNPVIFERLSTNPNSNLNYQLTGSFANFQNSLGNNNNNSKGHTEEKKNSKSNTIPEIIKSNNENKLPEQKITLSTSKEQILDGENGELNANYPFGAHISRKNKKCNMSSQYAYKKYLATKQDADQVLEKLNKLKEDSELRQNKYSVLLHKSKYYRNRNYDFYNKYNYIQDNGDEFEQDNENLIGEAPENLQSYGQNEEHNAHLSDMNADINQENENNELENEYEKMFEKIKQMEKMKMDYSSYEHLNNIKKFINDKGENITFDDIDKVNKNIDKLYEILNKKELLKKNLSEKNNEILENKKKLNALNENLNNKNNEEVGEVEEVEEEYEQESNDQPNYKDNNNSY